MTRRDKSQLSTAQQRAIVCLLEQPTIKAAAAAAGVSERNLHRWLGDPAFAEALAAAESEAVSAAARSIATAGNEAITVLRQTLRNPDATANERTSAARAILSNLPSIRLLGSVEATLTKLANGSNDE